MSEPLPSYICPQCGTKLRPSSDDGLWCPNGCYESALSLWTQLTAKHKLAKEAKMWEQEKKKILDCLSSTIVNVDNLLSELDPQNDEAEENWNALSDCLDELESLHTDIEECLAEIS